MFSASTIARRVLSKARSSGALVRTPVAGMLAPSSSRWMSELPYHLVVGMPALSPTMEAGVISEWKVKEGDSFIAGDSLAEIETDKATIDFEAQDDGVVAKILVEAGKGEITVNDPIMVTVEDEADVSAFADYVVEAKAAPTEPEPTPEPVVAAAPTPPPPPPAPKVATPPPPPTPAPAPVSPVVEEAPVSAPVAAATSMAPAWGSMAKTASPISKLMSASQKEYIELYGSTGQVPL